MRLYNTRDGKTNKQGKYNPGKTTLSEAQLIGRGARYHPFKIRPDQDKYKRKYDSELNNELRILEEIHYHSYNEPRYISEIKSALIDQGLIDEKEIKRHLKLKHNFKQTSFYRNGLILINTQEKRINENTFDFDNLSFKKKVYEYSINSNKGKSSLLFSDKKIF